MTSSPRLTFVLVVPDEWARSLRGPGTLESFYVTFQSSMQQTSHLMRLPHRKEFIASARRKQSCRRWKA
jgi:hypothetical protein